MFSDISNPYNPINESVDKKEEGQLVSVLPYLPSKSVFEATIFQVLT